MRKGLLTLHGLSAGFEECFPQDPRACNKDLNKDLWRRLRTFCCEPRLAETMQECSPLKLVNDWVLKRELFEART